MQEASITKKHILRHSYTLPHIIKRKHNKNK